jgi:hypothetical protein
MELNSVFTKAVDTVFTQFDSIAVDVKFTQILSGGFNFSTGQIEATSTSITARGILLSENSNGPTTAPSNRRKLLLKSGSIVPSYYNTASVDSDDYNIVSFQDNGFVLTLELVKDR